MAMIGSMSRNQNDDDDDNASSRKRFKTYDNRGVAPWSELNCDVLFLVMMQLGVADFVAFSRVCKSWRSLALSNRNKFMASKLPMQIQISNRGCKKECYLENFEGRKFKTILPNLAGRKCIGLACGYLVFFGMKTHDFWLVNPITRHQLHFPHVPFCINHHPPIKAILVFSRWISTWVLIVSDKSNGDIWFSIAGNEEWNYVSSAFPILDILAFKGKIYTLHTGWRVCEMMLNPKPKLTLLQNKFYFMSQFFSLEFASSGEDLYVSNRSTDHPYIYKLDFGEMKWMHPEEKTIGEYVFFLRTLKNFGAIETKLLAADTWLQYKRYNSFRVNTDITREGSFFRARMWYFPHECMNVDIIDE